MNDLTGKRYGKWLVVDFYASIEGKPTKTGKRVWRRMWNCICDCGTKRIVGGSNLHHGLSTSCGCIAAKKAKERFTTHGMTVGKSPKRMYYIWSSMKARCLSTKVKNYEHIKCDPKWLTFEGFREDMEEGYADDLSIDRIDNREGYFPWNCRWATWQQQCNNKRNAVTLVHQGVRRHVTEWSKIFGISYATMMDRIKRGWSNDRIFSRVGLHRNPRKSSKNLNLR